MGIILLIGKEAFYYCTNLQLIFLLESLISNGSRAFSYWKAFESIEISEKVTEIQDKLLYSCINLSSIPFIENATSNGNGVFLYLYKKNTQLI